jgi:hypothetical protein
MLIRYAQIEASVHGVSRRSSGRYTGMVVAPYVRKDNGVFPITVVASPCGGYAASCAGTREVDLGNSAARGRGSEKVGLDVGPSF